MRRLRVLRDVRDRLGDEVVDRGFDGAGQPVVRQARELDRDWRAPGNRSDRSLEASIRQNGRVNPARQLS